MDKISFAILVLILALAAHLVEEIKMGFREKFPLGKMPLWLFVGINVVLYGFCFSTLFLSLRSDVLAFPFPWIFAIVMLINGIGHVGIMILKREYFPGGLTAPVLIVVSMVLMKILLEV